MLNCQNVSTFKKMLYCLFLFRLLKVRPGNASKFFQNLDKNLFVSLYLCNCFLCVTTDGDLEAVTHKCPLTTTSHFRPMASLGFQHTETVCKDSRLNVIPTGSFSLSPPPPPFSFFFLFSPILAQMSLFAGYTI